MSFGYSRCAMTWQMLSVTTGRPGKPRPTLYELFEVGEE